MWNFSELIENDKSKMYDILSSFNEQISEAQRIGQSYDLFKHSDPPKNIIILGMGGSAIGGDLLNSYSMVTEGATHLKIFVNRNYNLPGYVDDSFHVIASSYSGGTEETISAFTQALNKSDKLLTICSGGKLGEIAAEKGIPLIKIPGGMQPRCALGYSFIVLLNIMMRSGAYSKNAIETTQAGIDESIKMIAAKSQIYKNYENNNPAIELAEKIYGKIPIFYSSSARMDSVNLRWRGQMQENAKHLAFGALLPEMNHNEINGWVLPEKLQKDFIFIFLEDKDDHPKESLRFDALENILKDQGKEVIRSMPEGKTLLARMLDSIYLGDWTSYYLALMNGQDPTAIPVITKLKNFITNQ
jgi:glucose/mannose-6-phosphate isomerase